jgi:hypothetical protein
VTSAILNWKATHQNPKIPIRDGREIRKDRLRKMLSNPKWEWRTIEVLETAIGEDEKTTVDLLLEIGARRSEGDRNIWTLQA